MSVISEGAFSLSVDAMRLCIASSKTYQEVTTSANEADALSTVIVGGVWETSPPEFARAIVRMDEGMTIDGTENIKTFIWRPPFLVTFEFPIPESYSSVFSDAYKWFMNRDGKICGEILKSCRDRPGEMPFILSAEHTIRPGLYDPDEQQGSHIGISEYRFEALGELNI